ncbi:M16 family metallopeptidase [Mariniluteicoccus flavus]
MTARPDVPIPAPWAFPEPTEGRLSNGIRVLRHPMPGQHVVSVVATVEVPLAAEPRDLEGVALLLSRVLDEGTTAHPGDAYAEALESVGAAFHASWGLSGLQVMLDVPATRLLPALELFAEALRTPEVRDEDVRRHGALRLAEIEQQRANAASRATMEFRAASWLESDRAHRMNGGDPETVAAVTGDDARAFHRLHVRPGATTLVIAGDLPDGTDHWLESALGTWDDPEPRRPSLTEPPPDPAPATVRLIDRPGSVQADVRLGGQGLDRRDPRWAPFQVAAYAVGGGFLSRLNSVLREDRGWTYGAHLQPVPRRAGGTWAVAGSFRTDVVVDAVVEARRLLHVADRPITDDEVRQAVSHHTGTSPLRYATAEGVADQQAANVLNGTPVDHVTRWLAALRDVTPQSATAAYADAVDLDALTLVVVGDAAALRPGLEKAGWLTA